MKLEIVHIYKDYSPILGGIENHIRLLAEAQASAGHSVTVLVTNPAGIRSTRDIESGVQVVRAGRLATIASTPLSTALGWQLARQHPDIVHLHFPYPVGELFQLLLQRGVATVLSYHSDVVRQARLMRAYRPILERLLAKVDAIVIASPPMRSSVYLSGHLTKLQLIPYGLKLQRFLAPPSQTSLDELAGLHPELSAEKGERRLLFVGRLRYYKGLDVLIRCLPKLNNARLLVAGSGPMSSSWHAVAQEVGVADRIVWFGDVPDELLATLYHSADIFVLPASHPSEAFGLVQVEAMAAGLPIISTELGTGTSYVNLDGITGRIVRPRDPEVLTSTIIELLDQPNERARLGAAARVRAMSEFALEPMVARIESLYADLLAEKGKTH